MHDGTGLGCLPVVNNTAWENRTFRKYDRHQKCDQKE